MGIKKLLKDNYLFVLVVLSTGVLTWASLASFVIPINIEVQESDKIAHCIAYFVFAAIWFFFFFFSKKQNNNFKQSLIKSSIICFIYGVLMEVFQKFFTTYRYSDWWDIVANTSGIIFVVILLKLFENKLVIFKKNNFEPK